MKKKIAIFLFTITLITILVSPVQATTMEVTKPKQVIVVIDRLSLNDISQENMPNLYKLQSLGSIALMNTSTPDRKDPANTYLTIADGRQVKGGNMAGYFYNNTDLVADNTNFDIKNLNAGQLYSSLTGWQLSSTKIVNPWIISLDNLNSNLKGNKDVGALGEILKANNIPRAVIGNADTIKPRRFAALLVMDRKGRVPQGIIDRSVTTIDKNFPYGIRTNYKSLFTGTSQLLKSNVFLVVELGDLSRLEEYRSGLTNMQYTNTRNSALRNTDNFIKDLVPLLDLKKDQIMILTPTPSLLEQKNSNNITPLIIAGPKFQSNGLLTSATTRKNGLISNIDIVPTILDFYNISTNEAGLSGQKAQSISSTDSFSYLKNFDNELIQISSQRASILYLMASLEIIIILLSILVISFVRRKLLIQWFQRLALAFMLVPLVFLCYNFIGSPSMFLSITAILVVIALITAILEILHLDFKVKISIVALATAVLLLIDISTGFQLMVNSPLGYDLMIGARYYGLGNEYSGILMGSTLLGLAALIQVFADRGIEFVKKIPLMLCLLIVAFFVFAPNLGADAGGMITSLATFPYFFIIINNKKVNFKKILILITGVLVILFAGAAIDHLINGAGQSHIGKAMGQLMNGQWLAVWNIAVGKLMMNFRLMQISIWSRVTLAVIAALAFFIYYFKGLFKMIEDKHLYIAKGIKAGIVASIVGGVFNDSGVVQAATTSIYVIFPIIYLALEERKKAN